MKGKLNSYSYRRQTCPRCGSDRLRKIWVKYQETPSERSEEEEKWRMVCLNEKCRALNDYQQLKLREDRQAMRSDLRNIIKRLTNRRSIKESQLTRIINYARNIKSG